jgi:hypothetical protein
MHVSGDAVCALFIVITLEAAWGFSNTTKFGTSDLVLSGYPQPFIDYVCNKMADKIQRKVEKHFLSLRSCPGFQNYICPK